MTRYNNMATRMKKAGIWPFSKEQAYYAGLEEGAKLNTQPPAPVVPEGWKLVPVEPTDEMVEAALDAHMPFGDMKLAIASANLSAPKPSDSEADQ